MSDKHKDRLGDKLHDKERGEEERFFAERDRQLLDRMKEQRQAEAEVQATEQIRMRCPKCGERLQTEQVLGVTVDECPACKGTWLDCGELKRAVEREKSTGWLTPYLKHLMGG